MEISQFRECLGPNWLVVKFVAPNLCQFFFLNIQIHHSAGPLLAIVNVTNLKKSFDLAKKNPLVPKCQQKRFC